VRYTIVAAAVAGCISAVASHALGQSVPWPTAGPERGFLNLQGYVDTVPDFVGPIDGSAQLTICTEGNHYPVLLPLVFDRFPSWCQSTGSCSTTARDVLVVTLPQAMLVDMLRKGGIRLGNAVIPFGRGARISPDLLMAGSEALRALAAAGIATPQARVFARHLGLGLLVTDKLAGVADLDGFAERVAHPVLASSSEAGARGQYLATLHSLLGAHRTSDLLARELGAFPGRMGIQHRDVPYALLNNLADGGIIFHHLAQFYAGQFPDRLRFIPVPAAAAFGQDIAVARVAGAAKPAAEAFYRFFLDSARTAYPQAGFAQLSDQAYGAVIDLGPAP
jgi:hypothetical protein